MCAFNQDDGKPAPAGAAERRLRQAMFALLITIFAFCVYVTDGRAHLLGQSGDTDSNQLLPIALLSGHGFAFDAYFGDNEPPYAFRRANGHVLAQYPILPGLLNTATFAVAKELGSGIPLTENKTYLSLVTGSFVTATSAGLVFLLLAGEGYAIAACAALAAAYAFGASTFSVASRGIWQHGPAVMFTSLALLLARSVSPVGALMAGLAAGLAVESRAPVLLLLIPLFVLPYQRAARTFCCFLAGFVLPIVLMRVYAWYYWDNPFVLAENMGNASRPFVGADPLEGLAGVLLSPGRGLLIYSPFMALAGVGFVAAIRRRDVYLMSVGTGMILYVVTVAVWVSWWGGKSYGTRMLTEIFPGGVLLGAGTAVAWWQRSGIRRCALAAAIAWSVLVNYAGARHYPQLLFVSEAQERVSVWSLTENELVASLRALSFRVAARVGCCSS